MKLFDFYSKINWRFAIVFLMLPGLFVAFVSCSSVQKTLASNSGNASTVSFLAGASAGGLVENSKMSGIEDNAGIDAITGATKTTFNAGVHTELKLKGHFIETGLDYMSFAQKVEYNLPSYSVNGERDFRFHQIRLPLTYNLHLFKNNRNGARFVLKAGMTIGYTFNKSVTDRGNVPEYEFSEWDWGPTLGLAFYPITLADKYRLGVYLDLFRGSRIFEDRFHTAEGMGGHSYMKFGVTLHPLNFKF